MSYDHLDENEQLIVSILEEKHCFSQAQAISPGELAEECAKRALDNPQTIESAMVRLIDNDIVEYEMNDKLETTQLWLLDEAV